jgi:hypothetical protein
VQDSRRNALKTDFVITCQKREVRRSAPVMFDESVEMLVAAIAGSLAARKGRAETYEIMNDLLIKTIPTGKIFRVSRTLEALKRHFAHEDGKWFLPSGARR